MPQGPRERLVDAAIALVRERGVEGTGIAELLERSGCARRSVYQHFPAGKLELVGVATRAVGTWFRRAVHELAETTTSADLLVLVVDQIKGSLLESHFELGCPIAAAALAPADAASVRAAAGDVFGEWIAEVSALLEREGRAPAAARSLAGFAVSALEGATMIAQATRSTEPLDQATTQLTKLLA